MYNVIMWMDTDVLVNNKKMNLKKSKKKKSILKTVVEDWPFSSTEQMMKKNYKKV